MVAPLGSGEVGVPSTDRGPGTPFALFGARRPASATRCTVERWHDTTLSWHQNTVVGSPVWAARILLPAKPDVRDSTITRPWAWRSKAVRRAPSGAWTDPRVAGAPV